MIFLRKKNPAKITNTWRPNNQWMKSVEIKEEIKKKIPRDTWKWKHNDPKPTGHSKSNSKKEVDSNTILTSRNKKNINKQPYLIPKATKERTNKAQS